MTHQISDWVVYALRNGHYEALPKPFVSDKHVLNFLADDDPQAEPTDCILVQAVKGVVSAEAAIARVAVMRHREASHTTGEREW